MRTFVLVLAIVLLPLRGWLGANMAMAEVPGAAPAVHASAMAQADATSSPCHESPSASTQADHGGHDGHAAHARGAGHGACSLCQLCHSGILSGTFHEPEAAERAASAPAALRVDFASAERAPARKPPIS